MDRNAILQDFHIEMLLAYSKKDTSGVPSGASIDLMDSAVVESFDYDALLFKPLIASEQDEAKVLAYFLYLTGYLTRKERRYCIPNYEIALAWTRGFSDRGSSSGDACALYDDVWNGDVTSIRERTQRALSSFTYFELQKTRVGKREQLYHVIFLAFGSFVKHKYTITSQMTSLGGRSDIRVQRADQAVAAQRKVVILELKHSETEDCMQADAKEAINQVNERYLPPRDAVEKVVILGISFHKNKVHVLQKEVDL